MDIIHGVKTLPRLVGAALATRLHAMPGVARKENNSSALSGLLSDAALTALGCRKVFDRGRTYAASGAVRVIEESAGSTARIRAQIDGTQTYETSIRLDGDALAGDCDCPHAADGWFCKHQVALCLTWRDQIAGTAPVVDDAARRKVQAAARRAQTQRERRAALHEFLRAQPASALAERLIDLAEHFSEIDRELRAWQKSAGTTAAPEELRALVSEALAIRGGFMPWSQVATWLRQAQVILPLLRSARERDAGSAAGVALHALRRGWAATQKADDSSGAIGDLCHAIAAEWIACLQATAPQPASFGDTWLRVLLEDPFGCVDARIVEQVMGEAALTRYRSLLAEQWRKADESRSHETDYRLRRIEALHIDALERSGDIDGALAVLRADLSEPHRCREITRFLEKHGRLREAFASAEDANRRFPADWQIEEDLLRAYERDGWTNEAHALRRRQFEARPDVQRYTLALKSGVEAGLDREALRAGLFRFMEQLEEKHLRAPRPHMMNAREREIAGRRNVSLRAHVLHAEGRLEEALQLVQPPSVCHPQILREIALGLGKSRHKVAIELLQRVFVLEMCTAQTPYREGLALVNEIAARMDGKSRAAWLAQLRVEFKAKRNFVRELPE